MIEVGDSPEWAIALEREVEGELWGGRLRVQCVEQPYAVRHPADLDEVLPRQTQDIRRREAGERRLERVESARAEPSDCLRRIRVGR